GERSAPLGSRCDRSRYCGWCWCQMMAVGSGACGAIVMEGSARVVWWSLVFRRMPVGILPLVAAVADGALQTLGGHIALVEIDGHQPAAPVDCDMQHSRTLRQLSREPDDAVFEVELSD